jgi:putative ABC transport system permease protein
VLVALQVAVAVLLLTAAGLVSRSFLHLQAIDLGFVPSQTITMNVSLSLTDTAPNEWFRRLLARLEQLPDVAAAGAVYVRPLRLGPIGQETSVALEGQDPASAAVMRENPTLNYQVATPGYFRALRIALLRGRVFDEGDTDTAPSVAIVSASTAERLWPRQSPIGKRISLPGLAAETHGHTWRSVVGVVATVRYRGLEDPRLDVYVPATPSALTASDLVVRGRIDATSLARAVTEEVRRADPGAVVDGTTSLDAVVEAAMAPWRFGASLFTAFAALSLVLATVGVVGLVGLDVAQRQREFAVRLAVGARKRHILGHVFGRTGRRVAVGLAGGTLAAVAATRSLQALLVGVDALDAMSFGAAVTLVAVLAALAAVVPAERAARTDPVTLLRRQS